MKTIEITKETAKKLYKNQPDWFQEQLESAFGVETFKGIDYTKLKTFNDLCLACGTTEKDFDKLWMKVSEALTHLDVRVFPDMVLNAKMDILVKAYNQDWVADPLDKSQKKWAPYFSVSSSGLVFSSSVCHYDYAKTCVGSRFAFENQAKSDHAGKTFTEFFQQFITNKI
jgi:hypothetical protein